jgi:hypothetical protein
LQISKLLKKKNFDLVSEHLIREDFWVILFCSFFIIVIIAIL